MSFTREIQELVCRYMKDYYNWDATPMDLVNEEWSSIVASSWDANVFYGLDNHYASLDDVKEPYEGMRVFIRKPAGLDDYIYKNGEWGYKQETLQSMYKV